MPKRHTWYEHHSQGKSTGLKKVGKGGGGLLFHSWNWKKNGERDQIKFEKKPMYFHNYLSSLERVGKTYHGQKRSGPEDANQEKD